MKTFNCDKFLKTFQSYFDVKVEKGRTAYYYGKKDLTIYYNNDNYLNSNDLRIMTMDFKYTNSVENLSLSISIPLDHHFNKNNGMLINSSLIKNKILQAKAYLPVLKKTIKASYNGKPYLKITCQVDQVKDERGIVRYKISEVDYIFELAYNIKENGWADHCKDLIGVVDTYFEGYFKSIDLDIKGVDYRRKLELHNMMEI